MKDGGEGRWGREGSGGTSCRRAVVAEWAAAAEVAGSSCRRAVERVAELAGEGGGIVRRVEAERAAFWEAKRS